MCVYNRMIAEFVEAVIRNNGLKGLVNVPD